MLRCPPGVRHTLDESRPGLYGLLELVRALSKWKSEGELHLIVVSNGMVQVSGDENVFAETSGLLAACTVIPQEYENIHCGTIDVAPDLAHAKYDHQAENNSQGRQQADGYLFEDARPLALGKRHDDRENPARGQIGYREYHQSHLPNRKVVQPFVHWNRRYTIFDPLTAIHIEDDTRYSARRVR